MSTEDFYARQQHTLEQIRADGLFKPERILASRQGAEVRGEDDVARINLCANNYLGLSGERWVADAAKSALDQWGYGLSSVRFICGTQAPHKALEQKLAQFVGTEDAILYAAAFDANGGVFEPLFDERDAIISDELNHASLIDGIRLCKAQRLRYRHNDMADLEQQLKAASGARTRVIVSDGVFSMDGTVAQLDRIVGLARQYDALTLIDECHATGFMGRTGRGTHEHHGVLGQIDIITGTLGKALGGAMGGFTAARREVIELLRQRSRPYLFSNALAPVLVGASLAVLDHLQHSAERRERLWANTAYWREGLQRLGFTIKPGTHPIVPLMLFEAPLAQRFAQQLYEQGVLASGFFYPVVPQGQARVRTQLSAAHTPEQLARALDIFARVGRGLNVITG